MRNDRIQENITDHFDESLPNLRDLDVKLNYFEEYVYGFAKGHCAYKNYVEDTSEYQQPPDPPVFREI